MKIVNEQQTAFENPKKAITSAPVQILYHPKRETLVICDRSPIGLGKHSMVINQFIMQVAYVHTPRGDTLKSTSRLQMYLLGGNYFTIATDHKPLLPLFNNPQEKLPPRIDWLIMKCRT